jgi:trimeric autotransporter adhesin
VTVTVCAGAGAVPPAEARLTPVPGAFVTDGPVNAMASLGNRVVLGGGFETIGPATGPGVAVSPASGAPGPVQAFVVGTVSAAIPDGTGAFFIGGSFTSVGGLQRPGVAHILPSGSVDAAWRPPAISGGTVTSLALLGGRLYVGGSFTTANGVNTGELIALDATNGGFVSGFAPAVEGGTQGVLALVSFGPNVLYFGGDFTHVSGAGQGGVAAVSPTTGALVTSFRPTVTQNGEPGLVQALATTASGAFSPAQIFLGGSFDTANGAARPSLVALDPTTGATSGSFTPPPPQSRSDGQTAPGQVQALLFSGSTLYLAGQFTQMGTTARAGIAAVDGNGNLNRSFAPRTDQLTDALALAGPVLYAGGMGGGLLAVDAGNGNPVAGFTGAVNGGVSALAISGPNPGASLYVAGSFTSAAAQPRAGLAEVNASSGTLYPTFQSNVNGVVYSLAVSGSRVYAGGTFSRIRGVSRRNLAAVNRRTGAVYTRFRPNPNEEVDALAARGSSVWAGGSFTSIGGQRRQALALLNGSSGAAAGRFRSDALVSGGTGSVSALLATSRRTYVGGQFNSIAGRRHVGLAAVSPTTGAALGSFNANLDGLNNVNGLALTGSRLYAAGTQNTVNGRRAPHLASVSATSGQVNTSFRPKVGPLGPNAPFGQAVAAARGLVFLGSGVNGNDSGSVIAVNPLSGAPGPAFSPLVTSGVRSLLVVGRNVFVGDATFAVYH